MVNRIQAGWKRGRRAPKLQTSCDQATMKSHREQRDETFAPQNRGGRKTISNGDGNKMESSGGYSNR